MPEILHYVDLNLNRNQLKKAVIEKAATAAINSALTTLGQLGYDTTLLRAKIHDGVTQRKLLQDNDISTDATFNAGSPSDTVLASQKATYDFIMSLLGATSGILDITRSDLLTLIASDLVVKNKWYRIFDAVDGVCSIVVQGVAPDKISANGTFFYTDGITEIPVMCVYDINENYFSRLFEPIKNIDISRGTTSGPYISTELHLFPFTATGFINIVFKDVNFFFLDVTTATLQNVNFDSCIVQMGESTSIVFTDIKSQAAIYLTKDTTVQRVTLGQASAFYLDTAIADTVFIGMATDITLTSSNVSSCYFGDNVGCAFVGLTETLKMYHIGFSNFEEEANITTDTIVPTKGISGVYIITTDSFISKFSGSPKAPFTIMPVPGVTATIYRNDHPSALSDSNLLLQSQSVVLDGNIKGCHITFSRVPTILGTYLGANDLFYQTSAWGINTTGMDTSVYDPAGLASQVIVKPLIYSVADAQALLTGNLMFSGQHYIILDPPAPLDFVMLQALAIDGSGTVGVTFKGHGTIGSDIVEVSYDLSTNTILEIYLPRLNQHAKRASISTANNIENIFWGNPNWANIEIFDASIDNAVSGCILKDTRMESKSSINFNSFASAVQRCYIGSGMAIGFTRVATYSDMAATLGKSTFKESLDMGDTDIFDAGVLTIPPLLTNFGIFELINNTGQTIHKIVNGSIKTPLQFYCSNGITHTFDFVAIATSASGELVSKDGVGTKNLVGRTFGPDIIEFLYLTNRYILTNYIHLL